MLVFGEIDKQAIGESQCDEWRCYGDSVKNSSFSRFNIYDLDHEYSKDGEDNDKDGRKEGYCGFALWVQNELSRGFGIIAGFDSSIDTKTHPGKTEDAYALENSPWYWARNGVVPVVRVSFD